MKSNISGERYFVDSRPTRRQVRSLFYAISIL